MSKNRTGFNVYPQYKNTRFYFDSHTPINFYHNQQYITARKEVLDFLGETLCNLADEANSHAYNVEIFSAFTPFLKEFNETKISPYKNGRQKFIDRFKKQITKLVPAIISDPKYHTTIEALESGEDDFNFDELDSAPSLSTDIIIEGGSCDDFNFEELETPDEAKDRLDELFSGDFDFESDNESNSENIPILKDFVTKEEITSTNKDFDDFDFTELDVTPPATEKLKVTTTKDKFDFSEFDDMDAEEPLTNAPTFMFSRAGYTLFISFNHMTFKVTGSDENVVYALQNLATLVFINHKFLTAKNHPEWLYSCFDDDLKVIFDKLTTGFTYFNDEERDIADSFIESSLFAAVLNYRNRLGYYKYHKPFVFEHE